MPDETEREERDQPTQRQRRGEESRLAFLEAGAELLNEQDLGSLLSTRAIASRAQRTTGSFFHYWPDLGAYMGDLLEQILRPEAVPWIENLGAMVEELAASTSTQVEMMREICDENFRQTVGEPLLRVQMLLWSKHQDERARAAVERFYDRADSMLADKYAFVATKWNRHPRRPFDYDSMAVILTALLEGLAIRRVVQPERVPATLYGEVVLALLVVLVRGQDDERTVDDLARELNSYPTSPPPEPGNE